jgi:hypothetical protein
VPKRTFWLVTGAALGAGSSLWAERRVRRTVQQAAARLQPDALVVEVGRSARQVAGGAGDRLRDALSSGRDEMLRREEELWSDLSAQGMTGDLVAPAGAAYSNPGVPSTRIVPSGPSTPEDPSRRRPAGRRRMRLSAKSASDLTR